MAILRARFRPRRQPGWLALPFCALVGIALLGAQVLAGETKYSEYDVKAAFLVSFARYVDWPDDAFSDEDAPLNIGVHGKNPFGGTLRSLASKQDLDGRKIVVRESGDITELEDCQVLFFAGKERGAVLGVMRSFEGKPVLTVGEASGLAEAGAVINFVMVDTKVKFEISIKSASRNNLKLSPRLLKLATRVFE